LKHINKLLLLALALVFLTACTTQKKRKELSTMGKLWHNTTAHYNGFFNAQEIIDASTLELAQQHQDNYLKLLDLYPYTAVDNPQAVAGPLDEAVKKVTVVINIHPYSQWSDDCYLLAGQALYLKQDYESAEKAFRYLINEYPLEDKSKEKASSSKGKKGKSGKSARSGSSNTGDKAVGSGLEDRPLTAREKDKARKAYNREVAKRKKQREKDRRRGKSAPRPPKTEATPEEPGTPTPAAPAPEPTPATEPVRAGLVRLSDDPADAADVDPDSYFLKHRPVFQEGQLWLARTLIERDNYDGARRLLNQLDQSPATFRDVRRETAVALAHLAIQDKDYPLATTALDQAIELANDKDSKARYAFIQAQLFQNQGNSGAAYAAYEQVVKLRPAYVMEFAARLNMAQNAYLSGQGSATEALANLEKMLKEDKNNPYEDQIYFAMAGIELTQGNKPEGLALLQKSLGSSTSNRAQKTEAYYKLGNLFYQQEEYLSAKLYFDSTLTLMAAGDERFSKTERLRNNLVDIAKNLEIITLQDSLLMIANLSPEAQSELAKQLNEQRNQGGTDAAAGATPRDKFNPGGIAPVSLSGGPGQPGLGATSSIQSESSFFAYDERTLKRGEREFDRRWGNRPLEDNWRRSNRSDAGFVEEETVVATEVNLLTQEQIDKILNDVPKDEGQKEGARLQIKKAMYELGRLYRDRLENNEKCVEILEQLNARYPGNIHELDSWYYLYLAYTDLNNSLQAKVYRDKILQKYPTSTYGEILQNPNYAQEFLNTERQLNRSYDQVYQLFEQGQHQQVLTQAQQNLTQISGKHPLKPRYALLMAMSTGSIKGKDTYISELQKVIGSYPNTPEETRAKEILRLLGGAGASLPGRTQEVESAFKVDDAELHYVIIVFNSDDIDLNASKITVSDYNTKYHNLDKLRISNVYLGDANNVPVLVLRRFKDKAAAMEYYEGVQKNATDFINSGQTPFQIFPITQSNYREVLRNRSVIGYDDFFQANY